MTTDPAVILEDLEVILNYLIETETTHFEETEPEEQPNHILVRVRRVHEYYFDQDQQGDM